MIKLFRPARRHPAGLLATTSVVALGLALAMTPSHANDTWTGTSSNNWFTAGNWSGGVPTIFDYVMIDTVTPNATVVGAPGAVAGNLFFGYGDTGTLTIQNGGAVSNSLGFIGYNPGSAGTVTVTGAGSSWHNSGALFVGYGGTGTLTIQNGGAVSDSAGFIGYNPGSTGTVTVSGAGASWTNSGDLSVGYGGTGALTIQNGGAVSNSTGWIGFNFGSTGTVTVSGAGSSWTNSGALYVGSGGTGTLTVANGGTVSVSGGMTIAGQIGSTGTLNIGAASGQAAIAPGTLNASSVAFGAGTGGIVFNHTASNYIFAPTISGAESMTVEAGTLERVGGRLKGLAIRALQMAFND
jgi:T5SS/PEP-CTERM-associated repeat protein